MDWLQHHHWEVWLAVAILLAIGEMASLDLILGMLATGALAGMVVALLADSWVVECVVAAIVAIGMLAVVRPSLARRLHRGADVALGNDRLIGMRGVVHESIGPMHVGRVGVDGEVWSASADVDLAPGTAVEVVAIRGATAHVRAAPSAHDPELPSPSPKEIR